MSDRASGYIFGEMFKKLASDPTPQHKEWAIDLWKISREYDFCDDEMHCDKALVKLGLARLEVDPNFPEDGKVYIYGPPKKSKKSK